MALLCIIGTPREAIRLLPGAPPEPTTLPTGNDPCSLVGGEYKHIGGVLHALYRSGGGVWLRIGDEDFAISGPLHIRCNVVSNEVLKTVIALEYGREIIVEEPIPAWMHDDPTFDHLTAVSTLWGFMVRDWLEDEESFHNRWGFARKLD